QLAVAQRRAGGVGEGLVAAEVPDAAGGVREPEEGRRHAGAPSGAFGTKSPWVEARISARCTVRVPASSRESPPPMCIRQEASPAVQTSACVDRMLTILSVSI